MRNVFRLLLLGMMLFASAYTRAQSDAENEYKVGLKLQKIMAVNKQKEAIERFEAAKIMFTDKAKQKKCDNQIALCRRNKEKKKKTKASEKESESETIVEPVKESGSTKIELSTSQLEFKGKPKNQESVGVICNSDDWSVKSKPDWVTVYIGVTKDRFSVEAEINGTGESRSGIIVIQYRNTEVNLIVYQKKLPLLDQLIYDRKNKKKDK